MNQEIIKTIVIILLFIVGFFVKYFTGKKVQVRDKAVELINEAETIYTSGTNKGEEKFDFVVSGLYNLFPAWLKAFIPYEVLADLVQNIFNQIESYAKKQLDDKLFPKE